MDFNSLVNKMRCSLLVLSILLTFYSVNGQTEKKEYFIFIGEKISVSIKQTGSIKIDTTNIITNDNDTVFLIQKNKHAFSSVYKIVKSICGNYSSDTILFTVYDEFKNPNFAETQHVLFFLEKGKSGEYFLLSNYYFDVYRTANGNWASDYSLPGWYIDFFEKHKIKTEFEENVYFDISDFDNKYTKRHYPSFYYQMEGSRVIPIYGVFADDLVNLLLKERLQSVRCIK
jgi:hypothetical protein